MCVRNHTSAAYQTQLRQYEGEGEGGRTNGKRRHGEQSTNFAHGSSVIRWVCPNWTADQDMEKNLKVKV